MSLFHTNSELVISLVRAGRGDTSLSKAVAQAETEKESILRNVEILKEEYRTSMQEARNEEQRARQLKENTHRELMELTGG